MIGKKNIVFGFIYLVFTAALGPYMINYMFPDIKVAQQSKQETVGRLQQLAENDFEEDLDALPTDEIVRANTEGILALNQQANARAPLDSMKGGPHAHGNLEAVLNIVTGLVLCFLAAPVLIKQAISWIFIAGTLLHSGMLYLRAFDIAWAGKLLGLGVGPILILVGLLLAGISAAIWFRGSIVSDASTPSILA